MNLQGREQEARTLFGRALAPSTDVGLLSAEHHGLSKRLPGGLPRVLPRIAVVDTGLGPCGETPRRGDG